MMEEFLNKSRLILQSLNESISSFYDLYDSLSDDDDNQRQDLLRAIILFSCSGIDAIVKQLVNDTLELVIVRDEGAFTQFKNFTEKKIVTKNDAGYDSKLLATLFTCDNPKSVLIDLLKRELTCNSLQSADELLKVGSYFNIETNSLEQNKTELDELKTIFRVRNQITHEMDVDMGAVDFQRRERTREEIKRYSDHIISLAEKFINLVGEKLNNATIVSELEQLMSI